MTTNGRVIFKEVPEALPVPGRHLAYEEETIDLDKIELKDGGLVLRNLWLSLDPYLRGKMRKADVASYSAAFEIGQPIGNFAVSEVVRSNNSEFKVGDITYGIVRFEHYTVVPSANAVKARNLTQCHGTRDGKIPLSYYVGALGMPGQTAFYGLEEIGNIKPGETLFISAAAGAVGQLVGQIGKLKGAYVVGAAGDDEKVKFLTEIGFDAAFNYKKGNITDLLNEHCPKGIDVYWENVGGEILEAVLAKANTFARIIACGMISQYNLPADQKYGVKNLMYIVGKQIRFQGFIVGSLHEKYAEQFWREIEPAIRDGKLKVKEDVAIGLEKAPEAFVGMLEGKNFGKQVIKVADLK
eukprot:TRINITY_DN1473_c0_g1_i1.p1 TRINITY_DN1473_c0_g1~~TRINITY_DN1473_c0_g1_i1.p1  ORF type:complete len:354 (-),score=112.66 TRINITY_DN1473_c0_g1_i1:11-1072(-)